MHIDPKLFDYCTPEQRAKLEAIELHGSARAASRASGHSLDLYSRTYRRVKARAALAGYSPEHDMTHTVPDGFTVKGVSTYYDSDGKARGQWVKSSADDEARKAMLAAAVAAMADDVPRVSPETGPKVTLKHLLTLYTFTDYHVGMLAWHREGGADWDVQIAERLGISAMQAMVAGSPQSDTAVVNIQGDFLHWDGLVAVTPTHGHVLDADSRFGKVVDVAIRLIRQLVSLALQKHRHVILLIAEGNHDVASSLWLRKLFGALYEKEKRLTVNDSELPYYAIEWGKTLLGFHHGHLRKNDQLPALFAAQFREAWGRCPKVAIHTGHRHHKEVKEHSGAEVIQHPTLAARDAYAARGGWWSERRVTAYTYHREFGEVATTTVTPEMLQ